MIKPLSKSKCIGKRSAGRRWRTRRILVALEDAGGLIHAIVNDLIDSWKGELKY